MRSDTDERYQEIIRNVEEVADLHIGENINIKFLCRTCKVSERTLRKAFLTAYRTTPYQYLRMQRMKSARKALLYPRSPQTSVTSVATDWGFLELGRFSGEYRITYGEIPSATLRRALGSCFGERGDVRVRTLRTQR